MPRTVVICALAAVSVTGLLSFAADQAAEIGSDVQLRAMLDELARSKALQLNNLDKPYFIQYSVSDSTSVYMDASLGGLTSYTRLHVRQPHGEVRVGDYKFDNTNSVFTGNPRTGLFPIDDDYGVSRSQWWLYTDGLYKAASDEITRKRAALSEIADPDKTPDLAPANPVKILQAAAVLNLDDKEWQAAIRAISGRFVAHPSINTSSVRLRAIGSTYRVANTEGTVVRIPQELADVEIVANGLARDGARVWNHRFLTALKTEDLPKAEELARIADDISTETEGLMKAPIGEDYSGPILFEGEAAGQLIAQVLTDAIQLERKPLSPPSSENRRYEGMESVWATKVNAKVAPDWLTIIDNPKEKSFEGQRLAGFYEVDDEGVPAQAVNVVEKGALKKFLLSRMPVHAYSGSNGHGRLPGPYGSEKAVIGNLFVKAANGANSQELRARMMEKVKAAGLKYGIVVRRLDFPSTANMQELQSLARQAQKTGYSRTVNTPLLIYRVYPDGREELIRGMRFREFSARNLRDLEAAGDHPYVFNYVNNGTSFNLAEAGSDATTSSVISPSLLFDSIDIGPAEQDAGRLPLVPAPALTPQQ